MQPQNAVALSEAETDSTLQRRAEDTAQGGDGEQMTDAKGVEGEAVECEESQGSKGTR